MLFETIDPEHVRFGLMIGAALFFAGGNTVSARMKHRLYYLATAGAIPWIYCIYDFESHKTLLLANTYYVILTLPVMTFSAVGAYIGTKRFILGPSEKELDELAERLRIQQERVNRLWVILDKLEKQWGETILRTRESSRDRDVNP